jgi:hypothetical protein
MADRMRWRYGETNPVVAAVDSAQTIDIGDNVYQVTDDARPADQISYSSLAQTQEDFVDSYLGVAMQRSRNGDTDPIRVATTSVFEFTCAAATFELGDLVGPDDNAGASALECQKVIAVTKAPRPIGRVDKRYASNTTLVLATPATRHSCSSRSFPPL